MPIKSKSHVPDISVTPLIKTVLCDYSYHYIPIMLSLQAQMSHLKFVQVRIKGMNQVHNILQRFHVEVGQKMLWSGVRSRQHHCVWCLISSELWFSYFLGCMSLFRGWLSFVWGEYCSAGNGLLRWRHFTSQYPVFQIFVLLNPEFFMQSLKKRKIPEAFILFTFININMHKQALTCDQQKIWV